MLDGRAERRSLEYECSSPDEERWFLMRIRGVRVDRHQFAVVTHINVTDQRVAEREIRGLPRIDPLTQLANGRLFGETIERAWADAERGDSGLALASFDIDGLAAINEGRGLVAGDALLADVAEVLRRACGGAVGISAARTSGDRFGLVVEGDHIDGLPDLVSAVLSEVRLLMPGVTASAGVAYGRPGETRAARDLRTGVDRALAEAKARGGDQFVSGEVGSDGALIVVD